MGSSWSTLLISKSDMDIDVLDSAIGLTKKEKESIRCSWEIVKKDLKPNGVALFIMFFQANPGYQKKFSSFADVPLSELSHNKKLLAHATSVMYAISSMVDTLEDVECLKEMVTKIARNHLGRDVTDKHFANLGNVLITFLEDRLGTKFTSLTKEAWKKLYAVILSIVKEVGEEEGGEKKS